MKHPRTIQTLTSIACDPNSTPSPRGSRAFSGSSTAKTPLRLASSHAVVEKQTLADPPSVHSHLADKLQWIAMNQPRALRAFEAQINAVILCERTILARARRETRRMIHNTSPMAALSCETNALLEYTNVTVYDDRALLAPVEDRLGRYMGDVIPQHVMERYLKTLHDAKSHRDIERHRFTMRHNQVLWRVAIVIPSPDRVVSTVMQEHGA